MTINFTLSDYYQLIDRMVVDYKYSKADIDQMYPFERDILYQLIIERQKEQPQVDNQYGYQSQPPTEH